MVTGMTAKRRTIQVSEETHGRIHDLAERLDITADEAVRRLFDMSAVPLHLSDCQRQRWQAYADASGVSLAQWIILRVEAAIQYGCDQGSMHIALDHLRALTAHHGVKVTRTQPPRPTGATTEE